jgi:hypothetical protein
LTFIRSIFGELVNLDHVQYIGKGKKQPEYDDELTYELFDKDNNRISLAFRDELPKVGAHVVPASPGYYLLDVCYDKDGVLRIEEQPIIAFELLTREGERALPYTLRNEGEEELGPIVIKRPDGKVCDYGMGGWDYASVEEWLAAREAKKRRRERAKNKSRRRSEPTPGLC